VLQIGRSGHSAPPARRSARPRQLEPARRSAVVHLATTSRERGRGGERRALPSPHRLSATMGVARGGGVAVQLGVGRLAAARGRRPTPGPLRPPGRPARRSRSFAWQLDRAKVAVLSPGWKPATQEWGRFRTVNWTPNPENRPQRERKAAARRGQNPPISRQNPEVARPGIEPGTPRFSGSRKAAR
jgi:hypothetical protein